MMYEEVLPYLKDGKKIRRKLWDEPKYCNYIYINPHTNVLWASFDDRDVEIGGLSRNNKKADDWEIYGA